jgi:hypothetical protein
MGDAPPQNQEEKRLIILLPAELLEEVRQAAEEADLSVSQIVRRAIRHELESIDNEKMKRVTVKDLQEALNRAYPNADTLNSPIQTLMIALNKSNADKKARSSTELAAAALAQMKARDRK